MEGAQVDPSNPRSAHVDWVVLCADCIRNAHQLLPEQADRAARLELTIADLGEQLAATQAYADRVEDALSHRPAERAPKAPPAPAPKAAPRQRKARYEAPAA